MTTLIKRYQNRKYYNINTKRYIALSHIQELIQTGEDIKIIDNNSGIDITGVVLTQIIFEYEKKYSGIFPPQLLLNLLLKGGKRLDNIWGKITNYSTSLDFASEIRKRMNLLVNKGEISKELGVDIINKLLAVGEINQDNIADVDFDKSTKEKSTPTDVFALIQQIENLSQKVDLFNRQQK